MDFLDLKFSKTCGPPVIYLTSDINNCLFLQLNTLSTKVQGISSQLPIIQSQYRQLSNNNTDLQTKVRNLIQNSDTGIPSPLTTPIDTPSTLKQVEQTSPLLVTPTKPTSKPTQVTNTKPGILET